MILFSALLLVVIADSSLTRNPLIGYWELNYNKTIESVDDKEGPTYACFFSRACGNTDFYFTENTVTAITFSGEHVIETKHTETYEIISFSGSVIEIKLLESDLFFKYQLDEYGIYHRFEEQGITEFYELRK
jgi:hypothetical protein